MDRSDRKELKEIFKKISSQELIGAEMQESKLIYSVVGFVPASEFVDNSLVISNLAYLLAEKGLNTCVIDFKVFYPNLHTCFGVEPNQKGDGLIKLLKSDKADLREEIKETKYERLYLLSPSPLDLPEEYFDFSFDQIESVINQVKNSFDIVLIDIPNNPPFEFCVAAMKFTHVGFITSSERVDAPSNIIKLFNYLNSIGISTAKFANVIMMSMFGFRYDFDIFNDHGLKIVAALPFVKKALEHQLEGELYVRIAKGFNRHFIKGLRRLADSLAEA